LGKRSQRDRRHRSAMDAYSQRSPKIPICCALICKARTLELKGQADRLSTRKFHSLARFPCMVSSSSVTVL
jgi:hypothetical protein